MSVYGRNSKLAEFIIKQSESYNAIADAVKNYAVRNRNELDFLDDKNTFIEFDDIDFKFAVNVTINGDTVEFDAVVEGGFTYQTGSRYRDFNDEIGYQWFGLHCVMIVTDKVAGFKVTRIESYSKEQKKKLPNAATPEFVPVISREQYETEAEAFLQAYCPEALTTVMQVPIRDIVERRMGLKVIDDIQLTKDLAVFGQICFNNGTIKTYNAGADAYVDTAVERGTIFIDPKTVYLRCIGCGYNTLAHEAFHWWRHRVYATVRGILRQENVIKYRCPTAPSRTHKAKRESTDEDWMERQANAIAPKILMPKSQTEQKIKLLVAQHGYGFGASDSLAILQTVIDELSVFYSVSKQAAKIRMIELGYPEAAEVYNYDTDCFYTSHEITEADAYYEARTNDAFKEIIDMELYRFAEGYFVINTDKYAQQDDSGNYRLTEYARDNLADCALNFRYDALDFIFAFNRESGVMYKQTRTPRPVTVYAPEINDELNYKALEEVEAAQKAYDDAVALGDETVSQTLVRYMKLKKWNSAIFQTKTGLNAKQYSNTQNKPNRQFELPILVSICVGLDLPHGKSLEILGRAGVTLKPEILEHSLYNHILSSAGMRNINACNEFLRAAAEKYKEQVHPLGSGFYDGDGGKDKN